MVRSETRPRSLHVESGASLVELVVAIPVLIAIVVGTIDFSRVFYTAIEVTSAARAGAQYGIINSGHTTDTTGMQDAAIAAAPDLGLNAAAISPGRVCECVGNADVSSRSTAGSCSGSDCTGSTHLVISVTVTTLKAFTMIAAYPGIPRTLTITRAATMRYQ